MELYHQIKKTSIEFDGFLSEQFLVKETKQFAGVFRSQLLLKKWLLIISRYILQTKINRSWSGVGRPTENIRPGRIFLMKEYTRSNEFTVHRTQKEKDYTRVDNKYLKDKNLSWKAKGLLTVILSLDDKT